MIKMYLHFHNDRNIKTVTVDEKTTIGGIIKQYAAKDAVVQDFEEDLEVYFQDNDEELQKDATLSSLKVIEGAHLHFSRCKKIVVTVIFNGSTFLHKFPPAQRIKHVLEKSLKHFKIDPDDGSSLSLFLKANTDEPIPLDQHMGSLTDYPVCSVTLYLAKKKTFLG